jgi:soluble lytic murein transglycosylase-like protein
MIRAIAFLAGAGALVWWWLSQQSQPTPAPAGSPSGDPQYFIPEPFNADDTHPMTVPQLDANTAAIVALAVQLSGDQDPAIVLGIIDHETGGSFNPQAYNGADPDGGAFGLMQIREPAARDAGYTGPMQALFDPVTNITVGVAYLDWIAAYLARHGMANINAMIAAYNEGIGNAVAGLPDYPYVNAVLANAQKWRSYLASVPVA